MSISIEEFTALQTQFLEFKTQNYDLQEKERNLRNEIEKQKAEVKKLNDVIARSKKSAEFNALVRENETLMRNMEQVSQQNREQQEALRANIKSLFQSNTELQNVIDEYKEKEKKQQREAQITKTLAENHNQEQKTEEANSIPDFDISEAEKKIAELEGNGASTKDAILKVVQDLWKTKMEELAESNKSQKDKDSTRRIQLLEDELRKAQTDAAEKEHTLNEQLVMWKEKTKIKQSNFVKLEEESTKELAQQKEKFIHQLEQKEEQIKELSATIKKKGEDITRLEGEVSRKKEELSVVQEDRQTIINKLSDRDVEFDKLQDQITMHTNTIEKLTASLNSSNELLQKERDNSSSNSKQRTDQLSKLTTDNQELTNKITDLEERLTAARVSREQSSSQVKELQKKIDDLEDNKESMSDKLKSLEAQILALKSEVNTSENLSKETKDEIDSFKKDNENLQAQVKEQTEKVKKLEEELSQKVKQLSELNSSVENLEAQLVERKAEISSLNAKIEHLTSEHKEVLRKQEEAQEELRKDLNSRITKEEELNKLKGELLEQITDMDKEMAKLKEEKEESLKNLEQVQKELQEKDSKIEAANRAAEDAKTEIKIAERKSSRQIKELKDQLIKERRGHERQMSMPSLILPPPQSPRGSTPSTPSSSNRSSLTPERSSPPNTPLVTPSSSFSSLPITPSHSRNSVPEPTIDLLQHEINAMVSTLGEVQAEKWKMEEKVGILQETVNMLQHDLEKKDLIIKNHVVNTKVQGRATAEMEVNKAERAAKGGIMASLFRGTQKDLPPDVVQKMSSVLEETLLKNIQLQNDISTMGVEISKLIEENKSFKQQLETIQTERAGS